MALETAADGVTVNSIQPGLHATDRVLEVYGKENMEDLAKTVPAQKIGSADDFGKIAAFLCSEQANFITGGNTSSGRNLWGLQ